MIWLKYLYQTLHYALSLLMHSGFIASFAFIQFSQSHCKTNNRYHFEEYDIYEICIFMYWLLQYYMYIYVYYIYNIHIYLGL